MKSVEALVTGRVQGVFYRASTQQQANKLGVKGWVKNQPDGSVLFYALGEKERVDLLIEWAKHGPEMAEVTKLLVKDVPVELHSTFEILR